MQCKLEESMLDQKTGKLTRSDRSQFLLVSRIICRSAELNDEIVEFSPCQESIQSCVTTLASPTVNNWKAFVLESLTMTDVASRCRSPHLRHSSNPISCLIFKDCDRYVYNVRPRTKLGCQSK